MAGSGDLDLALDLGPAASPQRPAVPKRVSAILHLTTPPPGRGRPGAQLPGSGPRWRGIRHVGTAGAAWGSEMPPRAPVWSRRCLCSFVNRSSGRPPAVRNDENRERSLTQLRDDADAVAAGRRSAAIRSVSTCSRASAPQHCTYLDASLGAANSALVRLRRCERGIGDTDAGHGMPHDTSAQPLVTACSPGHRQRPMSSRCSSRMHPPGRASTPPPRGEEPELPGRHGRVSLLALGHGGQHREGTGIVSARS